jgi:hypothetical protein
LLSGFGLPQFLQRCQVQQHRERHQKHWNHRQRKGADEFVRRIKPMKTVRLAKTRGNSIVQLPCACANLRRAARLVTQLYDDALRPSGLRATQFTLLQALTLAPGISQKELAGLLGIDSFTLTRTLSPCDEEAGFALEHDRTAASFVSF